jgi:uncharacterized protein YndB with AHSA1/START domain
LRYEVSVDIDAGADRVWAALADIERWPQWTASMERIRRLDAGDLRVGSRALVKQPRLPPMTWRVTVLEPRVEFTWEARSPGAVTVGSHRILRRGATSSTVVLALDQRGLALTVLRPLLGDMIRGYVDMEAVGLKRRVEAGQK